LLIAGPLHCSLLLIFFFFFFFFFFFLCHALCSRLLSLGMARGCHCAQLWGRVHSGPQPRALNVEPAQGGTRTKHQHTLCVVGVVVVVVVAGLTQDAHIKTNVGAWFLSIGFCVVSPPAPLFFLTSIIPGTTLNGPLNPHKRAAG